MNVPIGFVILVNPFSPLEQSARLITTLNRMFDHPPIACHQDFGKNPNFVDPLPPNVKMVRPHVNTKWADFSCIEAAVKTLRLLYSGERTPDWFVYLSGADYPIKPASEILEKLGSSPFDAHIDCQLIQASAQEGGAVRTDDSAGIPLLSSRSKWWKQGAFKRYCTSRITIPWVTKKLSLTKRTLGLQIPFLTQALGPFSTNFQCYAGEAWFCANRKAATAILDFYDHDRKLASHYRKVLVPEESYFHTVLGNAPGLKLSPDYLRYTDWTAEKDHPKLLTVDNLAEMKKSCGHFARKFDHRVDSAVLDALDALNG